MTDRERLFDWCVDQMQSGRMTLEQCIEQHASDDPDLAEMLYMVAALQGVAMPDTGAAKVRARARLAAAMGRDDTFETRHPTVPDSGRPASGPPATRVPAVPFRRVRLPLAALAAVVLLACGLFGLSTNLAAANALPGNPFYTAKRAEEWMLLQTAFSYTSRGIVLVTLADHRLTEASAEAGAGQAGQARSLLREYDNDVRQALALSAALHARGQDAAPVLSAVAVDLAHAQQLQYEAATQGYGTFAQMLQAILASNQQLIRTDRLTLPAVKVTSNGRGPFTGSPASRGRPDGSKAPPSNADTPADGHLTPSDGGKGHDAGNGNGHGGGNGTPTPPGH